jgi:hypothetical protein
MVSMPILFIYYAIWHYTRAPRDILQIWKNFLWFFYNFFSIPLLLLSLLAPFERLDEKPRKGFDAQAIFESIVVNILMRIVGFIVRAVTILIGLAFMIAVFFAGIIFFVMWLFAPFVLISVLAAGLFLVAV